MSIFDNVRRKHKATEERKTKTAPRSELPSKEVWKIGDKIQNRFEIRDIKGGEGKSGFGIVYICYDHKFKDPVALKTFQKRFFSSQKSIDDFTTEALTWIKLDKHKNIVKAKRVEKIERKPYIVLEYVAGGDLDEWIGTKMLDLPLALNIAAQFCNGMEHAYEKLGLIHRDVKPSNIMITKDKVVKITDFGLAKVVEEMRKEICPVPPEGMKFLQSNIAGTPPWMAPEQWTYGEIDTRTDIYAFGIILYQMVTGVYPYSARDTWKEIHFNASPLPIKQKLPDGLEELIFKCIEKNPEKRYQSFNMLKRELLEIYLHLTGKEISLEGETKEELETWEVLNKGLSLSNLGYNKEALEYFNHLIELNPGYDNAYVNRSIAYENLGEHELAIEDCNRAIELNPKLTEAYNIRAWVHTRSGKYEQAIKDYNHAIVLDPGVAEIYNDRGGAYAMLNMYELAKEDFNRAITLNPKHAPAYANLGHIYMKLGKYELAIDCSTHAIELNPGPAEFYATRGVAYIEVGKPVLGLKDLQRFLELPPPPDAFLVKRVKELLEMYDGEKETMLPEEEKWNNKGIIFLTRGKYEEAVEYFEKALEINPRFAVAWNNKGVSLSHLDKNEEAITCFDKALEINPEYANPKKGKEIVLRRMKSR